MAKPEEKFAEEVMTPWKWFKSAIGCYFGGAVLYLMLYLFEKSNNGAMMPVVVIWLYKLGGKWLVAGFCAFIGTACVLLGILEMGKKDKGNNEVDKNDDGFDEHEDEDPKQVEKRRLL